MSRVVRLSQRSRLDPAYEKGPSQNAEAPGEKNQSTDETLPREDTASSTGSLPRPNARIAEKNRAERTRRQRDPRDISRRTCIRGDTIVAAEIRVDNGRCPADGVGKRAGDQEDAQGPGLGRSGVRESDRHEDLADKGRRRDNSPPERALAATGTMVWGWLLLAHTSDLRGG